MDKSIHFKWILNRVNFYLEILAIFKADCAHRLIPSSLKYSLF